jgi:SAM-dependent methyltransferase
MNPHIKHLVFRFLYAIIGWPNFLRRLQWYAFWDLLEIADDMVVIDLGAGQMQYSLRLAQGSGANIIAVDLNFPAECADLVKPYGIKMIEADALALPLEDHTADRILMSSLLQMVPNPLQLLRECRRVLKPGGHVVLSVPNHYQFIPALMRSFAGPVFKRLFGLPRTYEELVRHLNERFHVGGPQGYYSIDELTALLESSGFCIAEHKYVPGWLGSLLWEFAVLGYVRFGNFAFHLLFLAYPLVLLCDIIVKPAGGSEHILKVSPVHEN